MIRFLCSKSLNFPRNARWYQKNKQIPILRYHAATSPKSAFSNYSTSSKNACSNKDEICTSKTQKWPTENRVNFQFHSEVETLLNAQINAEFNGFYCYLSMANYFGRVDVALPGCEAYFTKMHDEEHMHAMKVINYLKMRGGSVHLNQIEVPQEQDWKCPLKAFTAALNLEIKITEHLETLNFAAQSHRDSVTSDFITTDFLSDQMKSVNEIAKLVTVLSGVGDYALARFIFDRDLLSNHIKKV